MDIKNVIVCLILMAVMVGGYLVVKHFGKGKLDSNISSVLWGIPFVVYGYLVHRTAWMLPVLENTEYIPYAIGAIALEAVLVLYCSADVGACEDIPTSMYRLFVRQTVLECVLGGILMPALFMVSVLVRWLNFSFLYINGAVVLVSLIQVFLYWLEERDSVLSVLELILNFAICVLHGLIMVFTGSVLIPVILRVGYGIFAWRKGRGREA